MWLLVACGAGGYDLATLGKHRILDKNRILDIRNVGAHLRLIITVFCILSYNMPSPLFARTCTSTTSSSCVSSISPSSFSPCIARIFGSNAVFRQRVYLGVIVNVGFRVYSAAIQRDLAPSP